VLEETSALIGIALQRGVKHPGNLLPALGRHFCVFATATIVLGPEHPCRDYTSATWPTAEAALLEIRVLKRMAYITRVISIQGVATAF